ncbi:hypothetical protein [Roseococcus sp. YIM B11640]|uniref:hypothetical protein n=1 Tax=Roseococcus sp. YIM B11640 TaxID=3133973 RepID=UPI003C7E3A99
MRRTLAAASAALALAGGSAAWALAPTDSSTNHYVVVVNETAAPITGGIVNQGITGTVPARERVSFKSQDFRWTIQSTAYYRGTARNAAGTICEAVYKATVSNGAPTTCEVTAPSSRCGTSASAIGNACYFSLTVRP